MPTTQQIDGDPARAPLLTREFRAPAEITAIDDNRMRLSVSSEYPVLRESWFDEPWIEILDHTAESVNLERFSDGAPVQRDHSNRLDDQIGVIESAEISDDRSLVLDIRFSQRESLAELRQDIADRIIRNVSIGYMIHERTLEREADGEPDTYRVTNWTPFEASFVAIPADPTVGARKKGNIHTEPPARHTGDVDSGFRFEIRTIETAPAGANTEEATTMPTEENTAAQDRAGESNSGAPTAPAETGGETRHATAPAAPSAPSNNDAIRAERDRAEELHRIHDDAPEFARDAVMLRAWIVNGTSADQAAREMLARIGQTHGNRPATPGDSRVEAGADQRERFVDGMTRSILARSPVMRGTDDDDVGSELRGLSLVELARAFLRANGQNASGRPMEMIGRAFTLRSAIGHSTSDFANVLSNVIGKAMLMGYDESVEVWDRFCRIGNLSDFKQSKRVGLDSFDDLDLVRAGGEYKYGSIKDRGEPIELGTYGKLLAITREAIINDDLDAFTRVPQTMGRAASRVPGDLAFAILTSNPVLSDGVALFAAGHSNLGTGGAISVTTVSEMKALMRTQTDTGGANGLNIRMQNLIVPVALEDTAAVLAASEYDPSAAGNTRSPNPHRNTFEVVSDARLDADSSVQYYGAGNPAVNDTIEVAFLDGISAPTIEEKTGWTVDGVEMKVRIDCAASALDHRAMVRNAGA